jgi:GH43 family beta-xylosidase
MDSKWLWFGLAIAACAHPHAVGGVDSAVADSPADAAPTSGLRGFYYAGAVDLAADRVDAAIDFTFSGEPAPGVGADHFAVRWTGTVVPPVDGSYGFAVDANDGVRLWVGGTKLIDAWSDGAHTTTANAMLSGPTPIKLTYYLRTGSGHVTLSWQRPDGTTETIPSSALVPADDSAPLASPPPPYQNAVDPSGCADPGAIAVGGTYYVVCTGGRFQIRQSRDLVTWTKTSSYILPSAGAPWASGTNYRWAPEIHAVGSGFVAYFVSEDSHSQRAIGAATASSPLGPWTPQPQPLVTNTIGVIDPTYFADSNGKSYLIWKLAGNSSGVATVIYLRELTADGLSFASGSSQIELIRNDPTTWEGAVVEAPWLIAHDGTYYLFYSGNYINQNYRVGVARASTVTGPYTKHGAPILGNNTTWVGPGHNSSVQIDGVDYLVYHAYEASSSGGTSGSRVLMVDQIDWVNGWPQIHNGSPSTTMQPRPGTDPDL